MPPLDMSIPVAQVRWKIQTWNKDAAKPRALYVPYFDARDVADTLDRLFGWDGWSDEVTFHEMKADTFAVCRLTVHAAADHQEATKTDAASLTDVEAVKGGASDAFKRAAAKLGVGRNAYALSTFWDTCEVRGQGERARPYMPDGLEERLTARALQQAAAPAITAASEKPPGGRPAGMGRKKEPDPEPAGPAQVVAEELGAQPVPEPDEHEQLQARLVGYVAGWVGDEKAAALEVARVVKGRRLDAKLANDLYRQMKRRLGPAEPAGVQDALPG